MWLTPHPRDLIQPEGERERELSWVLLAPKIKYLWSHYKIVDLLAGKLSYVTFDTI